MLWPCTRKATMSPPFSASHSGRTTSSPRLSNISSAGPAGTMPTSGTASPLLSRPDVPTPLDGSPRPGPLLSKTPLACRRPR